MVCIVFCNLDAIVVVVLVVVVVVVEIIKYKYLLEKGMNYICLINESEFI